MEDETFAAGYVIRSNARNVSINGLLPQLDVTNFGFIFHNAAVSCCFSEECFCSTEPQVDLLCASLGL